MPFWITEFYMKTMENVMKRKHNVEDQNNKNKSTLWRRKTSKNAKKITIKDDFTSVNNIWTKKEQCVRRQQLKHWIYKTAGKK